MKFWYVFFSRKTDSQDDSDLISIHINFKLSKLTLLKFQTLIRYQRSILWPHLLNRLWIWKSKNPVHENRDMIISKGNDSMWRCRRSKGIKESLRAGPQRRVGFSRDKLNQYYIVHYTQAYNGQQHTTSEMGNHLYSHTEHKNQSFILLFFWEKKIDYVIIWKVRIKRYLKL